MDTKLVTRIGVLLGIVLLGAAGVAVVQESPVAVVSHPVVTNGGTDSALPRQDKAPPVVLGKKGGFAWKLINGKRVKMPSYTLSGCNGNSTGFNGTPYAPNGTLNGAVLYQLDAGHMAGWNPNINAWVVHTSTGGITFSAGYFYSLAGNISTFPTTGWTIGGLSTSTVPPTVTLVAVYATPPAPKITNIHDGDAFTLHNSLPWDASWVSGHGLYVPGLGALNDTDATFDIPATGTGLSQALAYKFAIEDSDVEGPETKIISAPAIVYDGDYIVAPSTRPVADAILTLQLNFYDLKMNAEFIDFATDVEDSDRINVYRKPRNTLFRWKVDFPAGYGGQNGSDEFSTSEPLPWKGQNIAALVSM